MAEILPISQSEFLSLATERGPLNDVIYDEKEWYADEARTVLGVLIWDRIDQDWAYVVLRRDPEGVFRAEDLEHSFSNPEAARSELLEKMRSA